MMRPLDPGERMSDRFDRAYTLNFTTVATVRGALTAAGIEHALRCLERRHPLLRASLVRAGHDVSLALGRGAPVALFIKDAPLAQVPQLVAESIDHEAWQDEGPRAQLTWVRHGERHATLLLRWHHVISDGSSGVIALRDLLRYLDGTELDAVVPLASPGQESFFPSSHATTCARFLEQMQTASAPAAPGEPILRLARFDNRAEVALRRARLHYLRLGQSDASALAARAPRDGATVHGVLNAALARSVAEEHGAPALQRLTHPVDLRRYLRELEPSRRGIGDEVGYYVSSVTTEHVVAPGQPLDSLARDVTAGVRAGKAAGEPLTTAPLRGPYFVERTRDMPLDAFRTLAEQRIFTSTFGITNLGPLERLGVAQRAGALDVEDFYFVSAASVMNQLSGSAVSFAGRLVLVLVAVEPLVSPDVLARLAERTEAALLAYAREPLTPPAS
jgi:hypothetical protein